MQNQITAVPLSGAGANSLTILGQDINVYGAFLTIIFIFFGVAFWVAHRKKQLDWLDMITRDGRKVSTTKILQLIGGVVGTWIIIKVTIQGNLTWDLFAIYLGYVASVDGFSKLITAKYSNGSDNQSSNRYSPRSYQPASTFDDDDMPRKRSSKLNKPVADMPAEEDDEIQVGGGAKAGG